MISSGLIISLSHPENNSVSNWTHIHTVYENNEIFVRFKHIISYKEIYVNVFPSMFCF